MRSLLYYISFLAQVYDKIYIEILIMCINQLKKRAAYIVIIIMKKHVMHYPVFISIKIQN